MNYKILRDNSPAWDAYMNHAFVQQLADGSLPKDSFLHYLKQDYLFLIQFTRAFALAVYKSDGFAQMRAGQAGINAMLDTEISLHIDFCKEWGMIEADIMATPESSATVAYTRYVLDAGMTGTLAELYAALAPCMLGYAEIGKRLGELPTVDNNPYQPWIDMYASQEFQDISADSEAFMNGLFSSLNQHQAEKLQCIFDTATRMEVASWQMGLDLT